MKILIIANLDHASPRIPGLSQYLVNKKDFIREICVYKKLWEPYCTVATWYLWRDIDEDVVQY